MYTSMRLPPPAVGGGRLVRAFRRAFVVGVVAVSAAGSPLGCGVVPATLAPDPDQPNQVSLLLQTGDGSATATAPLQATSVLDVLYDTTHAELTLAGLSLRLAPVSLHVEGGVQVDVGESTASLDLSGGLPLAQVDPVGNFQLQLNLLTATAVTIDGVTIPFVHTTGGAIEGHIEYVASGGSMVIALEGIELLRFILVWGPDLLVLTGDLAANFSGVAP